MDRHTRKKRRITEADDVELVRQFQQMRLEKLSRSESNQPASRSKKADNLKCTSPQVDSNDGSEKVKTAKSNDAESLAKDIDQRLRISANPAVESESGGKSDSLNDIQPDRSLSPTSEHVSDVLLGEPSLHTATVAKPEKKQPVTLFSLPNEMLIKIMSYLHTEEITIGNSQASLWHAKESAEYKSDLQLERYETMQSLSKTSRRLRELALPLMYKNLVVTDHTAMIRLLRTFIQHPERAQTVRHVTCTAELESRETVPLRWVKSIIDAAQKLGGSVRNPDCRYSVLMHWLIGNLQSIVCPRGETESWTVIFFAILALATRVKTLNLRMENPRASLTDEQRSSLNPTARLLWTYFLDVSAEHAETRWKSDPRVPQVLHTAVQDMISEEAVVAGPRWPPPSLEKLTVECGSFYEPKSGRNFIERYILPKTDVWRMVKVGLCDSEFRNYLGLLTSRPFKLRNSQTGIAVPVKFPTEVHEFDFNSQQLIRMYAYLDGFAKLPHLRNMPGIDDHIMALKRLSGLTVNSKDLKLEGSAIYRYIDRERQSVLHGFLKRVMTASAPGLAAWNSRMDFQLYNFLNASPWQHGIQQVCGVVDCTVLTIRFDSRKPSDKGLPNSDKTPPHLLRRLCHLLAYYYKTVEYLRLPLYMDKKNTDETYFLQPAQTARLRGRLFHLPSFKKLKHLEVTTEGLFGPWEGLKRLCLAAAGEISVDKPISQALSSATTACLPASLSSLWLTEWYSGYVDEITADEMPSHWFRFSAFDTDRQWRVGILVVGLLERWAPILRWNVPQLRLVVFECHPSSAWEMFYAGWRPCAGAYGPREKPLYKGCNYRELQKLYAEQNIKFYITLDPECPGRDEPRFAGPEVVRC